MKFYNIAGVTVGYGCKYPETEKRSRPYLCTESGYADFTIKINYDDFDEALQEMPLMNHELLEYMRIGSCFYSALLDASRFRRCSGR